ncbi:hypothetical protein DFP72DRAFT_838505 [Ephemerocybe angulata]|uniref:Uncharacterized protein n=1 Tax=Ephemerocybe angulata TaxID=980116 RepID=A0A8H6IKU6_9AGAR|nr:hypothetical protein DFP72DRAFT_838505 [Tulosesus angulatus]
MYKARIAIRSGRWIARAAGRALEVDGEGGVCDGGWDEKTEIQKNANSGPTPTMTATKSTRTAARLTRIMGGSPGPNPRGDYRWTTAEASGRHDACDDVYDALDAKMTQPRRRGSRRVEPRPKRTWERANGCEAGCDATKTWRCLPSDSLSDFKQVEQHAKGNARKKGSKAAQERCRWRATELGDSLQIPATSHRHFSLLARRLDRMFTHAYSQHREALKSNSFREAFNTTSPSRPTTSVTSNLAPPSSPGPLSSRFASCSAVTQPSVVFGLGCQRVPVLASILEWCAHGQCEPDGDEPQNQVRPITQVTKAIAGGDLIKKNNVDARGEILDTPWSVNAEPNRRGPHGHEPCLSNDDETCGVSTTVNGDGGERWSCGRRREDDGVSPELYTKTHSPLPVHPMQGQCQPTHQQRRWPNDDHAHTPDELACERSNFPPCCLPAVVVEPKNDVEESLCTRLAPCRRPPTFPIVYRLAAANEDRRPFCTRSWRLEDKENVSAARTCPAYILHTERIYVKSQHDLNDVSLAFLVVLRSAPDGNNDEGG